VAERAPETGTPSRQRDEFVVRLLGKGAFSCQLAKETVPPGKNSQLVKSGCFNSSSGELLVCSTKRKAPA
jgi:hypothetical protein